MRFPALRVLLAGGIALAGVLSLSIPTEAVSVCQKKNRLKLRSPECKTKETSLGEILFEGDSGSEPVDELFGIWQADARVANGFSILTSPRRDIQTLVLNQDGSGQMTHSDVESGLIRCSELQFTQPGDLVVDTSGDGEDTAVWLHEVAGDVLTLRDAAPNEVIFERVSEADPAFGCTPLTELRRFEGVPDPHSNGSVALDSDVLYYQGSDDLLHAVSAVDGGELTAPPIEVFDFPVDSEPGAIWGHCNCGGSPTAALTSLAGVQLDLIDFDALVEERFRVREMATDAANNRVWAADNNRILEVTTGSDTVISDRPFGHSLAGLFFDGSELWFVTNSEEVGRMDPATLEILESFQVPGPRFNIFGMAIAGNEMFFLGRRNNEGVILVVEKP